MICKELNRSKCKTYLVGCEATRRALLIDPLVENIDRYLALLAYKDLELVAVLDTHTHADHSTAVITLADLTDADIVMHRKAPSPRTTRHVDAGDNIEIGNISLQILYTPGHTPDSISLYGGGRVFTGDVLLIGGTGRADFAGGDAGDQYDAITQKLFTLPDETIVLPAHDYRGNTESTIAAEKHTNPRIAGRSREQYIALMNSLEFPLPQKIQEVLQPNQSAIDDDKMQFPTLTQLNDVRQLTPQRVRIEIDAGNPVLLDVREPVEYTGELGHIPGSILIPLKELPARAEQELDPYRDRAIIAICRAGVRSTTAAAILIALGFENVSNLKGGMLDWNDQGLSVERG
jgi:glyoxylase-like metal-dependent hydrolase (beta-lactamase superfamily II)/rhodanese-related sulfurtransferase